jgi:hypothetical protein
MPMNIAVFSTVEASLRDMLSSGASSVARLISERWAQITTSLQESNALGNPALFDDLQQLAAECAEGNWDGHGAAPVQADTIATAQEFLLALPLGTPRGSVGAEPDGHVTIEWYSSPKRTLSVSVSPDGNLHYAALLGAAARYGTEPFLGQIPRVIVELIHAVTPR